MPLHLLAKKSWNVYNTQNIERVRRDEEAARKKEEEEEMRMQREDGERRLMELRRRMLERKGEGVIVGGNLESDRGEVKEKEEKDGNGDGSKAVILSRREEHRKLSPSISTCPTINPQAHSSLIDHHGHINLFSNRTPRSLSSQDKNPEYEKEKAEKEAKLTEQYSLSLGKPAQELRPWYVSLDKIGEKQGRKTQEQVGVEKKRDEKFKDSNDPIAAMRRGIKQLREVEEGRKKVEEERKGELERLRVEQEEEGLEGFSLDDGVEMSLSCRKEKENKRRRCRSRSKDHKSKKDNIHKRHRQEKSKSPEGGSEHRRRKSTTCSKDDDRQRNYRDRGERNSTGRHHHHQSRNRSRSRRRDRKERDGRVHADRHDDCGYSAGKRKDEYHHRGRESRSMKHPRGDERRRDD